MRNIIVLCVVAVALLVSVGAKDLWTTGQEPAARPVAVTSPGLLRMAGDVRLSKANMSLVPSSESTAAAFCGQCSDDEHCGTGWKCCGPSSCLECFNVVTCP